MIHFVVLYYYNTFIGQYSLLGCFMLRHFVTAAKTSETAAPFRTKLYQVIYISGIVARKRQKKDRRSEREYHCLPELVQCCFWCCPPTLTISNAI